MSTKYPVLFWKPWLHSSVNPFLPEIAGVRTKVQGQRGTTNQNPFQQNDPSQHLPPALQPALNQQLTSGCQQGNTHRSHQCVSLHTLTFATRVDLRGRFIFLAHLLKMCFPDSWWPQIWLQIYFKFACSCWRCWCRPTVCGIRDEHSGKGLRTHRDKLVCAFFVLQSVEFEMTFVSMS